MEKVKKPEQIKGIKKLAYTYLDTKVALQVNKNQEAFILTKEEQNRIKQIKIKTLVYAALIGFGGVLAYYLPIYAAENVWGSHMFKIANYSLKWVDVLGMIYGILLIWPEIWLLNVINMRAVKDISIACNYPNRETKQVKLMLEKLTDVGLELDAKELQEYGINPYLGMNKIYFWALTLFMKFKATLSNIVVKLVLKRLLGRYALRAVTDLAGMPVFGFWNAWASNKVIEEAKMRIMLPEAINEYLTNTIGENSKEYVGLHGKILIQYIAQLKRKYNYAMYLYALQLEQFFGIELNKTEEKQAVSGQLLSEWSKNDLHGFTHLVALGFCVDGALSRKEKKELQQLMQDGQFALEIDKVQEMAVNFKNGKGFKFIRID